ncbi:MAG: hypothetical protein OHK0036_08140 [Bacteroidia bacterium]
MKVLIISSFNVHLNNFLNLLNHVDSKLNILVASNFQPQQNVDKFCLIHFSLKNPFSLLKNIIKLSREISDFSPDIIHIHQANSVAFITYLALLFSKHKPKKKILTTWGSDILILPEKNFLTRWMVKFALKKSDLITYDAKIVQQKIQHLCPELKHEQLKFFFYGIDLPDKIDFSTKENIIYSNRLHKSIYRIDKIINAFSIFSQKNKNWKLIIAANGQQTDDLKKLVISKGLIDKIEFVGWLNKLENMQWYLRSKIYVTIPESDAGSVSLIEAMACGCYCIVSDIPANIEMIETQNGYVVSNVNDDFFSPAIESYIKHFNPEDSRKKVEFYSKDNQSKLIYSIYKS